MADLDLLAADQHEGRLALHQRDVARRITVEDRNVGELAWREHAAVGRADHLRGIRRRRTQHVDRAHAQTGQQREVFVVLRVRKNAGVGAVGDRHARRDRAVHPLVAQLRGILGLLHRSRGNVVGIARL